MLTQRTVHTAVVVKKLCPAAINSVSQGLEEHFSRIYNAKIMYNEVLYEIKSCLEKKLSLCTIFCLFKIIF